MKKNSTLLTILISFIGFNSWLKAQTIQLPLSNSYLNYFEEQLHHTDSNFHTTYKPYIDPRIKAIADKKLNSFKIDNDFTAKLFGRKLMNEDLIKIKKKDEYSIYVNPVFNGNIGVESDNDDLPYTVGRGIELHGSIGKKFFFYSDAYDNLAIFPTYINNYVNEKTVTPGQGIPRDFQGLSDFANVSGHVTYRPSDVFTFQFGRGKNFIGDGYRSLLLSDNSFNYPYLKIITSFWKIQYTNLFSQWLGLRPDNQLHYRKYAASHYLSWNVTKRFNLGVFETVIYNDSTGVRGLDMNYLNPIIFYRPIEFALGSRGGNVLLGLTAKYKVNNNFLLYGQFILDEFKTSEVFGGNGWWANKYGYQIGFKSFNTGIPNLTVQSEFNLTRPYTYSHQDTLQNYAHYNQPMTHTLGSNFVESVSIIRYYNKRWFGNLKIMYAVQGLDTLGSNWGSDLYLSNDTREQEYGNELIQGVRTTTFIADLNVGYLVNPVRNMRLQLGYRYRNFKPEIETADLTALKTNYFYLSFLTDLKNLYYDF